MLPANLACLGFEHSWVTPSRTARWQVIAARLSLTLTLIFSFPLVHFALRKNILSLIVDEPSGWYAMRVCVCVCVCLNSQRVANTMHRRGGVCVHGQG